MRELQETRARLISLVDEHEASDEENQQTTEDALSANEELQSLTEELETAKEELQATNEELLTVNRELESRNLALLSARDMAMSIVENVGVPLLVVDRNLVVKHINSTFATAFRLPPGDGVGQSLYDVSDHAWNVPALRPHLRALAADQQPFEGVEIEREFAGIGLRVLCLSGRPLEDLGLLLITVGDVTTHRLAERALRLSEEQRRQSEKMEVIGRLAGGIAHDFNNLLTIIIGNADLVTDLVTDAPGYDHTALSHVQAICRAAEKAAALTDQLLSFSRRKVLQPKVFDLNPLILDFQRMLGRLLGDPITIVVNTSKDPCFVRADPTEIGRVVMNLCVNARDAMPAGGSLTMETGLVTFDATSAARSGLPLGRYVQLLVTDTGLGMDAETRRHAFEPFYTTKDISKGAGLGLSTVFGIMKQSGGAVICDSELGQGTRFTVLLPPAVGLEESAGVVERGLAQAPRGSEVVLLVEDDEGVRGLTRLVLERSGYQVLDAMNGREGLALITSHTGPIDLLVTDVLMPGLSGGALAAEAMKVRPMLKVLFVSGHVESTTVPTDLTGMSFLQKPYAPGELAAKVRSVLDVTPTAARASGRTPGSA
jgi:signal transduction histidine kinase/CheY-like chemotaxis protein